MGFFSRFLPKSPKEAAAQIEKDRNEAKKMHKGGMVKATTQYTLQKGEMVVPKSRVKAVKNAMKKANLKTIK